MGAGGVEGGRDVGIGATPGGPVLRRNGRRLASEPAGFTHRDYQSRNIMVLDGGEQAVIDFQDALLGPRQYDLVSLLRDSYVTLDQQFIGRMVRRYLVVTAGGGGAEMDEGQFREVFDLLTIQRKLKDAGRFVYIDRVKGNPDFLRFVPVALATSAKPSSGCPRWRTSKRCCRATCRSWPSRSLRR